MTAMHERKNLARWKHTRTAAISSRVTLRQNCFCCAKTLLTFGPWPRPSAVLAEKLMAKLKRFNQFINLLRGIIKPKAGTAGCRYT